jgi:hypothetical protein
MPLLPIIPLLGRGTPCKSPLDAIGDGKDDDCADEDTDNVRGELAASFGRIEEGVDVESLSSVCNISQAEVHRYATSVTAKGQREGEMAVPRMAMIKMICDQGCNTTAENKTSNKANPEFIACLLIFDQAEYRVANVPESARRLQYTTVTTNGNVMIVEKRTVCASWSGRYHLLRGELPVKA